MHSILHKNNKYEKAEGIHPTVSCISSNCILGPEEGSLRIRKRSVLNVEFLLNSTMSSDWKLKKLNKVRNIKKNEKRKKNPLL